MWVVKLGGSLCTDPALPQWLQGLARLGGGRVTIVPGGGGLADEVRRLQAHWQFDDLPAHNMAVLAMAQNAWMLHGLQPALQVVCREADIAPALRQGRCVVWAPLELLRQAPDDITHWGVTSDSLALDLARRLHVERLLLVKACDPDDLDLATLAAREVLDSGFLARAEQAEFPIDVLHGSEWDAARALLLGELTLPR